MSEVTAEMTKTNKSKLILNAFKSNNLKTPANEIIEFIKKEHDVEVTASLVNNLRHRLRKQKSARKKTVKQPPATDGVLEKLMAVKEFAGTVGGLEVLKMLVDKLERLAA